METAAKRGVTVVRRQRKLIAELLDVAGATLEELRQMQLITLETYKKKRTKHVTALVAGLSGAVSGTGASLLSSGTGMSARSLTT